MLLLGWFGCVAPWADRSAHTVCTNPSPPDGETIPPVLTLEQAFPFGEQVISRSHGGEVTVHGADLRAQRVITTNAAVIGHAGGDVLLARANGKVAVAPGGVDPVDVDTLSGTPIWLGESDGQRLAVGLRVEDTHLSFDVLDLDHHTHRTLSSAPVYSYRPLAAPSAILEDRGVLYLGWDWGEWGGALTEIRLADAQSSGIADPDATHAPIAATVVGSEPVYGFSRVDDEVWAYGGTMHMGMHLAWVATAGAASRPIYDGNNFTSMTLADPPPPARPELPITHLFPGADGDVLVFSFSDVWRAERALSRWDKIGDLPLWYTAGRPDAVGNYPAVTSAWREGDGITFATRQNGLCRWTPAR